MVFCLSLLLANIWIFVTRLWGTLPLICGMNDVSNFGINLPETAEHMSSYSVDDIGSTFQTEQQLHYINKSAFNEISWQPEN